MAERKLGSYYDQIYRGTDESKVSAQAAAASTAGNWKYFDYKEVPESRGESVFIIDIGDRYLAGVLEGLGTKNLVADAYRGINGQTNYYNIARCHAGTWINDLVASGARPMAVWEHRAAGESAWFRDQQRTTDLNLGMAAVCNEVHIVWAGGETPTLRDMIVPGAAELSGFLLGEINPKERYVKGDRLQAGDAIVLVASSGMHANGYTGARQLADELPEHYATRLSDGSTFGEALLAPTFIYSDLVQSLLDRGLDIHRIEHITGHGFGKLMRAKQPFTYRIH